MVALQLGQYPERRAILHWNDKSGRRVFGHGEKQLQNWQTKPFQPDKGYAIQGEVI